jgi:hypothetical protein
LTISKACFDMTIYSMLLEISGNPVKVQSNFQVKGTNVFFSQIDWLFLLVEETGENHRPVVSHWQTLSHNTVSSTPRLSGIQTHNVGGDKHWLHR